MNIDNYIIVIGILNFLKSFISGQESSSTNLAASFGSNAQKLAALLILGSICEFIGSFLNSTLANTLINNITSEISEAKNDQSNAVETMMLAASIASMAIIITLKAFQTTPSIIISVISSSMISTVIALNAFKSLDTARIGLLITAQLAAPLLCVGFGGVLQVSMSFFTLNQKFRFQTRLSCLTVLASVFFALQYVMFASLYRRKDGGLTSFDLTMTRYIGIISLFASRFLLFFIVKPDQKTDFMKALKCVLKFWTMEIIEDLFHQKHIQNKVEEGVITRNQNITQLQPSYEDELVII